MTRVYRHIILTNVYPHTIYHYANHICIVILSAEGVRFELTRPFTRPNGLANRPLHHLGNLPGVVIRLQLQCQLEFQ